LKNAIFCGSISQKSAFFIVKAVKTSKLIGPDIDINSYMQEATLRGVANDVALVQHAEVPEPRAGASASASVGYGCLCIPLLRNPEDFSILIGFRICQRPRMVGILQDS
jgi:hypothetical protein